MSQGGWPVQLVDVSRVSRWLTTPYCVSNIQPPHEHGGQRRHRPRQQQPDRQHEAQRPAELHEQQRDERAERDRQATHTTMNAKLRAVTVQNRPSVSVAV